MVDGALEAVNLSDDPEASGVGGGGNTSNKRVKTFSGGMKRRLSVGPPNDDFSPRLASYVSS